MRNNIYTAMLAHAGILREGPGEQSNAGGGGGGTQQPQQMPSFGNNGGGQQVDPLAGFNFTGAAPISEDDTYEADLAAMLQTGPNGESLDNNGGIDPELAAALQMFGTADNTNIIDDTQVPQIQPFQDASPEAVQGLEAELTNFIKNLRVPDNAIPENFDPTDRTQMQTLLSGLMRNTISQSLAVVFKPMQLAMKTMANQIDGRMQSQIQQAMQGNSARTLLSEVVPEVNNPQLAPMILTMDSNLKNAGKKPAERAQAIRKVLNQMGFKPSNVQSNNGQTRRVSSPNPTGGQGNNNQQVRQGTAALDSIFGVQRQQQW